MPKCDGKTVEQRFHERYEADPVTGCWNWTAGKNTKWYGYIWVGPDRRRDTKQAYKVGWEFIHGPVPEGLELHHKCENNACVNPSHLALLTVQQHRIIGTSVVALNAAKTHCKRGHEFTPEITRITSSGGRRCTICTENNRRNLRALRANRKVG